MLKEMILKETHQLTELYERYKSMAHNPYVLAQKLEVEGLSDDEIEAFITYIRWNTMYGSSISLSDYKDAKDTLYQFGYFQEK